MRDIDIQLLRLLESEPSLTQKEISQRLGVSAGKVNYCLRALIGKGLIKMHNFTQSPNKKKYAYLLTPKGVEAKARLTYHFLQRKLKEYERLKREIEELQKEYGVGGMD